jgi:putative molybdopterin biosynthesis protein
VRAVARSPVAVRRSRPAAPNCSARRGRQSPSRFTHLAVAAAIASGVADAGIGIEAAARKLKLDFIPLFVEDYYLLGKRETVERTDVEAIVKVIKSDDFAALVKEIPGYDSSHTGEVKNVTDVIG